MPDEQHHERTRSIPNKSILRPDPQSVQPIKLFDMPHMAEQRTLKGDTDWVRTLAVTADNKVLISAGDDPTIRFWDLSNGRCFRTIKAHTAGVRGITLSPDGMKLASASWDRTVKLWAGGPEPQE